MVCRAAFDRSVNGNELLRLVDEVLNLAGVFGLVELFPSSRILQLLCGSKSKLLKIHRTIDGMLNEIIDDHLNWYAD